MTNQRPGPDSWLQFLVQFVAVTGTVTLISVGSGWVGIQLWSFFRKPSSAFKHLDNGYSAPIERPSKKDNPPEASLTGGSPLTNRIDDTNETLRTLKLKKNLIQETIRANEVLIKHKELLIRISNSETRTIQEFSDSLRESGLFTQKEIELEPNYSRLAVEESIRNNHRAEIVVLREELKNLEASIPQIPTL